MPESDQQLVGRIEVEIRVENLKQENFDVQIIQPRIMFSDMPGEFREDPETWVKVLAKVVPLTHELAHIAEFAIGQRMNKQDPRRQ